MNKLENKKNWGSFFERAFNSGGIIRRFPVEGGECSARLKEEEGERNSKEMPLTQGCKAKGSS